MPDVWDLIGGALDWLNIWGTPGHGIDIGVPGPGWVLPGQLPIDIPLITAPDLTPLYHGGVVKQWVANGVLFQKNADGTITVQSKKGVKTYRPRFHNPAAPPKKFRRARNRFLAAARQWKKVDYTIKVAHRVRTRRRR